MADEMNDQQTTDDATKGDREVTIPTDFDITKTKEFGGVVKDLQGEREKRQEIEGQMGNLQAQLNEAHARITEFTTAKDEPGVDPEFTDDDLITAGQARAMWKQQNETQQKQVKDNRQAELNRNAIASEQKAKTEFTVEKCGEGLDWESVYKQGFLPLANENPEYFNLVKNDPNPAQAVYRLGKTYPAIEQRLDAIKSARLVSELDKNKGTSKPTQTEVIIADAATQEAEFEKAMAMDESELLKIVQG